MSPFVVGTCYLKELSAIIFTILLLRVAVVGHGKWLGGGRGRSCGSGIDGGRRGYCFSALRLWEQNLDVLDVSGRFGQFGTLLGIFRSFRTVLDASERFSKFWDAT